MSEKKKQTNAIYVWDYTIPEKDISLEELKKWCNVNCKTWCFQKEKGEKTDYIHWQMRISLKDKTRTPPKPVKGCNYSPTSNENKENNFYVLKEETRIEGPWKDDDPDIFIPYQFDNITLKPWQQTIIDSLKIREPRIINYIYDPSGNSGKSTVASIAEIKYGAVDMPPINDMKELMQIMCCECRDFDNRDPKGVFIDLPRAMDKDRMYGIYCAIEQIKKGKLYDTRNHYKKYWIHSPQIWVFSNTMPDITALSADRWRFYKISKLSNKLIEFEAAEACNNAQIQLKKRII